MSTQETDAEPTSGPWRNMDRKEMVEHEMNDGSLLTRTYFRHSIRATGDPGEWQDNRSHMVAAHVVREKDAELIAAAGTAAYEVKEMGYDPQAAVEALPEVLQALDELADWWDAWMPDNAHAQGGGEALRKAQDALASAEGDHE